MAVDLRPALPVVGARASPRGRVARRPSLPGLPVSMRLASRFGLVHNAQVATGRGHVLLAIAFVAASAIVVVSTVMGAG